LFSISYPLVHVNEKFAALHRSIRFQRDKALKRQSGPRGTERVIMKIAGDFPKTGGQTEGFLISKFRLKPTRLRDAGYLMLVVAKRKSRL